MSPKQFLIACALLVMSVAGVAYAANWTPYVPFLSPVTTGQAEVQIYPPSNGTTQTFAYMGALAKYTIGTLPTCTAALQGYQVYVTNGVTSPTYLATVSSTGAVVVAVMCDGTNWTYQ